MKKIFFISLVLLIACIANGQEDNGANNNPLDESSFANSKLNKCMVKIRVDTCLYDTISKKTYQELLSSNAQLQEDLNTQAQMISGLQTELKELEVDDFLNLQDTTIFGSRFMDVDTASIPARSREFYVLIKKIHDLNCVINSQGSINEIIERLRGDFEIASDIIKDILAVNDNVFLSLSKSQKEYYFRLEDSYNQFYDMLRR